MRHATVDRAIARVLLLGGVATLVVTTSIAYRSLGELTGYLTDPLTPRLQEADATGLWSANLMLLQVLLLARLPWLERAWGRQVLTRWHRHLGTWSVWLMLLHVLLFVVQRVSHEPERTGSALYRLFVTEPWMWAASLGTVMVLLVVVSSILEVRRRLRYETWHLLHLWAYVGMAMALPHQLVGQELGRGWTGVYWWSLYLVALAGLVWFRVLVPLHRTWRSDLRVDRVRQEQAGVVSIEMTGRHLDELGAQPGQFLVWRFLAGRAGLRGHPYSLSSAPSGGRLRVTVSTDGDGGRHAAGLRPGTRVAVEGPYGALGDLPRRHPRLLLLAAGVGITPFRALVEGGRFAPGEVTLLHRVPDARHVLLGDELDELAAQRRMDMTVLSGPRRAHGSWLPEGVDGSDHEVLLRLVPDLLECDVVVCGPFGWSAAVRRAARAAGVADRDVHTEEFGW
ncbi:Predicted ferric reductase [Nocardioides exalbidus]|uniref:Predicted ferric reductase n=1 Tax=Nocardioides exalbidus TaxID=402596 RepID=A0A1H4JZD7_9ACTN|nr:ferredoxin reductase family protein [Nocardioides exalbidus]SEB51661.1 Predicted ferric reductase [Nocardioides exalbidus]